MGSLSPLYGTVRVLRQTHSSLTQRWLIADRELRRIMPQLSSAFTQLVKQHAQQQIETERRTHAVRDNTAAEHQRQLEEMASRCEVRCQQSSDLTRGREAELVKLSSSLDEMQRRMANERQEAEAMLKAMYE